MSLDENRELKEQQNEQQRRTFEQLSNWLQNSSDKMLTKLWWTKKIWNIASWFKDAITGNINPKISGWINKLLYFILMFGILNIIYFTIFDILHPYIYWLMCLIWPLTIMIIVGSSNQLSIVLQKIFFNEKELSMIIVATIITYFIVKIVI